MMTPENLEKAIESLGMPPASQHRLDALWQNIVNTPAKGKLNYPLAAMLLLTAASIILLFAFNWNTFGQNPEEPESKHGIAKKPLRAESDDKTPHQYGNWEFIHWNGEKALFITQNKPANKEPRKKLVPLGGSIESATLHGEKKGNLILQEKDGGKITIKPNPHYSVSFVKEGPLETYVMGSSKFEIPSIDTKTIKIENESAWEKHSLSRMQFIAFNGSDKSVFFHAPPSFNAIHFDLKLEGGKIETWDSGWAEVFPWDAPTHFFEELKPGEFWEMEFLDFHCPGYGENHVKLWPAEKGDYKATLAYSFHKKAEDDDPYTFESWKDIPLELIYRGDIRHEIKIKAVEPKGLSHMISKPDPKVKPDYDEKALTFVGMLGEEAFFLKKIKEDDEPEIVSAKAGEKLPGSNLTLKIFDEENNCARLDETSGKELSIKMADDFEYRIQKADDLDFLVRCPKIYLPNSPFDLFVHNRSDKSKWFGLSNHKHFKPFWFELSSSTMGALEGIPLPKDSRAYTPPPLDALAEVKPRKTLSAKVLLAFDNAKPVANGNFTVTIYLRGIKNLEACKLNREEVMETDIKFENIPFRINLFNK